MRAKWIGWPHILAVWFIANLALVGLAAIPLGGWYLSRPLLVGVPIELGLIMLPNLVLAVLALSWSGHLKRAELADALGWRWSGWRVVVVGVGAFALIALLQRIIARALGPGIPYDPPNGGPLQASTPAGAVGLLLFLLLFAALTVAGEETMFRGFIQGQVSARHGVWAGVLVAALLFGLRHLPADLFYAHAWSATPAMWISRQLELYAGALILGLARHYGRSTWAPALTHTLLLLQALF